MLTQLGIALIVIGFFLPIIIFFIVRKIRANIRNSRKGELFVKDGHDRIDIIKDGKDIPISLPFLKSNTGLQSSIPELSFQPKLSKDQLIIIYEDKEKRKVKEKPITEEEQKNGLNQDDPNKPTQLEPIPEEEEKQQEISSNENRSKDNQKQNQDQSLMIQPMDVSDISMDFKKTPSFRDKPCIDFYENASAEDLSMLKDMISNHSPSPSPLKDDYSQISNAQPQYQQQFKNSKLDQSNMNDKSTDHIFSQLQHGNNNNRSPHQNNMFDIIREDSNYDIDTSTVDELVQSRQQEPYYKLSDKHRQQAMKFSRVFMKLDQIGPDLEDSIDIDITNIDENGFSFSKQPITQQYVE